MKYIPLLPYWKPETAKRITDLLEEIEKVATGNDNYTIAMAAAMIIVDAIQTIRAAPPKYGNTIQEAKLEALREIDKAINFMFDGWQETIDEEEVVNTPIKKEWIN